MPTKVFADVGDIVGYIRAGTPFIWVRTSEYQPVTEDIIHGFSYYADLPDTGFPLSAWRWDTVDGLQQIDSHTLVTTKTNEQGSEMENYPLIKMEELAGQSSEKRARDENYRAANLMFLLDYHEFIDKVNIWRHMQNLYGAMEENGVTGIIVSPKVTIPEEIRDYVVVLDYPYPDENFIKNAVQSEVDFHSLTSDDIHDMDAIVNAALGLSRVELLQGINFSLAESEDGGIHAEYIKAIKEARLAKDSSIKILPSEDGFETLVGMDRLKTFAKRMILSGKGRGILLLGVPGSGKSAFAGTLGFETKRTTLSLDFANLMGGIVGETEQKTEHAIKVVDSMQPCILFIDEIEKGLAGVSGYNGDSGTSRRQGSLFLKWLSDHKTDVFVIATANSIADLPPEFKRAERWDAIFFLDVPGKAQADAILQYYAGKYEISEPLESIEVEGYTGAEIKSMCRLANALGVSLEEAKTFINPITESFDVEALRSQAAKCACPAEQETPTQAVAAPTHSAGRPITRRQAASAAREETDHES